MKQVIKRLLRRLILWALSEEVLSQQKQNRSQYDRFQTLRREVEKLRRALNMSVDVALDHHYRYDSWMVVATRKPSGRESVHFYGFKRNEVQYVRNFLQGFERDGVIIDTCPGIPKEMFL